MIELIIVLFKQLLQIPDERLTQMNQVGIDLGQSLQKRLLLAF